jgi:hypothetical protein
MNIMYFDTYKFLFLQKICVDSFSELIDLRCSIHKFFFFHMIGMNLLHCTLSSIGFLHHQIHRQ